MDTQEWKGDGIHYCRHCGAGPLTDGIVQADCPCEGAKRADKEARDAIRAAYWGPRCHGHCTGAGPDFPKGLHIQPCAFARD